MAASSIATPLTDKQKRQLEKLQRRKKYSDLAIQGTNNSSIASKRSVEVLYCKQLEENKSIDNGDGSKEYFKYFVPKAPKRSPCINRGYWLRLHAIRSRLEQIADYTNKDIVVINLGCGFDPLPFQLLDEENAENRHYAKRFSFLDVDYADLIKRKTEIIKSTPELVKIIGGCFDESKSNTDGFSSAKYEVLACNLNQPESFRKLLENKRLSNRDLVKVFIAEVSLAYMKPDHADAIISLCATLPSSHFLILEQLIPQGPYEPFSKQMLKHFIKNDSPLQSVLAYQTMSSQVQRFTRLGFKFVNEGDMYQLWQSVDSDSRLRIQNIEPFDELEEFQLFSHHYIILHGANFECDFSHKFVDRPKVESLSSLNAHFTKLKYSINRKFGSAVYDAGEGNIIYFGGCDPCRVNDIQRVDPQTGEKIEINCMNSPSARMCHTVVAYPHGGKLFLLGGRKGPIQGFSDTWLFDYESKQWEQGPDLPETRFRHCAKFISEDQILLFGGNTRGAQFLIFEPASRRFKNCKFEGAKMLESPLISASMDYNIECNKGVIIGGSHDGTHVSNTLFVFSCRGKEISILKEFSHPLLQRYGSKVTFLNDREILIAGGTSSDRLFGRHNVIILVNIETEDIKEVPIAPEIWEHYPLFLVGFELLLLPNNEILIIGGGATCYGFGSVWNQGFQIKL